MDTEPPACNPAAARAIELQTDRIREMTPRERLAIASELYELAWGIKMSSLRQQHPDWTPEQVHETTRRIFQTGHAGA